MCGLVQLFLFDYETIEGFVNADVKRETRCSESGRKHRMAGQETGDLGHGVIALRCPQKGKHFAPQRRADLPGPSSVLRLPTSDLRPTVLQIHVPL